MTTINADYVLCWMDNGTFIISKCEKDTLRNPIHTSKVKNATITINDKNLLTVTGETNVLDYVDRWSDDIKMEEHIKKARPDEIKTKIKKQWTFKNGRLRFETTSIPYIECGYYNTNETKVFTMTTSTFMLKGFNL